MTIKELSRLYELQQLIIRLKTQLAERRAYIDGTTSHLTGLPHGQSDKTALLADTADLAMLIKAKEDESVVEYNRLNRYILSIRDPEISNIVAYRFVNGMSWQDIAHILDDPGDGSTQRKKLNRFLRCSNVSLNS